MPNSEYCKVVIHFFTILGVLLTTITEVYYIEGLLFNFLTFMGMLLIETCYLQRCAPAHYLKVYKFNKK